ncbi:hypothetical protein BKA70DRAFT_1232168 [Coprinopsis sp. MPI-PUGE-AT-0042]|nr:hypothetical protein BKA70DRAFT_1232168 [Coprinopsis sp. MPI-PUGE-AT-0042]
MFQTSSPLTCSLVSPILLPLSPLNPPAKKPEPSWSFGGSSDDKENTTLSNVLIGLESSALRNKKPTIPVGRLPMTPGQRKIHKLEEKIRRLESKLYRAERQGTVHAEQLVELASENQTTCQELQDALEEGEEANARVKELQRERDQYYAWWINEVKFSQSLLDSGYPYLPGIAGDIVLKSQIANRGYYAYVTLWHRRSGIHKFGRSPYGTEQLEWFYSRTRDNPYCGDP